MAQMRAFAYLHHLSTLAVYLLTSWFSDTLGLPIAGFTCVQSFALAAHRCATLPGWSLRVASHHRPTGYESVALLLSYRGIYHFNPSGQGVKVIAQKQSLVHLTRLELARA